MLVWKLTGVMFVERAVRSTLGFFSSVEFVAGPAGALLLSVLKLAALRWNSSEVFSGFNVASLRLLFRSFG